MKLIGSLIGPAKNVGGALLLLFLAYSSVCPSICLSICCLSSFVDTLTQSFITGFLPNFIYLFKLSPKFKYVFVRWGISKMMSKLSAAYHFALVDTLT